MSFELRIHSNPTTFQPNDIPTQRHSNPTRFAMKIQPKQCLLKRMLTGGIVAITIAFTPMIASGQDSVRDRLSPGNGADWAGEPQVETDGYAGEDSPRFSPPGPEQAWYRGADGRFFFRDQDG